MEKSNSFLKSTWFLALIFILIATVIISVYAYIAYENPLFGEPSPEGFGNFGAYIGGTAGALFGIVSAILLFKTFTSQREQLALTQQEVEFAIAKNHLPDLQSKIEEAFGKDIVLWYTSKSLPAPDPKKMLFEFQGSGNPSLFLTAFHLRIRTTIEPLPTINSLRDYQHHGDYILSNEEAADMFAYKVAKSVANYEHHISNEEIYKYFESLSKRVISVYKVTHRLHVNLNIPLIYLTGYLEWLREHLSPLVDIYTLAATTTLRPGLKSTAERLEQAESQISEWLGDEGATSLSLRLQRLVDSSAG
ncbi:hypothetical protein IDSA_04145 [Pseudidiomarina salinarum]|uniref:Uncharacterized protein n=1 Tax=Pseudidiomarina salinarum TaxID=435908 RepID=A0A094IXS4_9GAMM|nr:hypothetical protein [Pseudidiomarina salinarum]KFZ31882.1 hypothetical protein IDSA_04145 [Pseudidiomarina salinarum]RUO70344.1 hypothetical protein CWI79_02440 [Pseudidiomarina salinarum]